ncbi:hypothetical protein ADN00_17820 [Ornatilinea apprima]|uniref:Methyl-accepting transducer domain-containing protein n=1 Tax=Ornatilinea apprima TaxID=1134406 RepID=A0A0P6WM30_9CHLR|nr:methyl-accepting chemotaxis protein [Ornatilinea apprima]KPL70893.1 hypothetical protein ADN00_17820 [Ornatilinea apprima]
MNNPNAKAARTLSWNNLNIRAKFISIFILTILAAVISLTVFSYFSITSSTTRQSGESMIMLSRDAGERAALIIQQSASNLEVLALSPDIVDAVNTANRQYAGLSEEQITQRDEAWQNNDPSIEDTVRQIEQNQISNRLRDYMRIFPENVEVFATGSRGLNIAMSARTGDFLQAGEDWWEQAKNSRSTFISDVELDASSGTYAINIATPIQDAGEVIGVLRTTVDVSIAFSTLSQIKIGETGAAALVDRNGTLLYTDNADLLMQTAPDWLLNFITDASGWSQTLTDLNGNPAVLSYYKLTGKNANALGWTLVLDQDLSEVNQTVRNILINNAIIAVVLMLLLGAVGITFANSITRPLAMMSQSTASLSRGEIDQQTDSAAKQKIAQRGDEIGVLGQSILGLENYFLNMAETAQQIARGNLTAQVQQHSSHDVLGRAFQEMSENLRERVTQLNRVANDLGDAAKELASASHQAGQATSQIASTIQQVAHGITQQSDSVSTTSFSVEQMTRTIEGVAKGAQDQASAAARASLVTGQLSNAIQQVAGNALAVTENAKNAAKAASDGQSKVEKTVQGMLSIRDSVEQSARTIEEMGTRSNQIGMIVDTIQDLASQTNLLALNAAIEAARAGEHGKGFAVVADEVRKLAESSAAATREISTLIAGIQATVKDAIATMQQSSQEVAQGVEQATASGQALTDILRAISDVQQQAEQAAAAAEQMNAASSDLVNAVDTVSAVIEENTAATEEMSASSNEVSMAIETIASISEENSAAVEEVSASAEEISAQVEEVSAAAQSLSNLAGEQRTIMQHFQL